MKRVLVAYTTMSGSTAEVAQVVGDAIAREGVQVDVVSMDKVADLAAYDAAVIGAPMILGWHRSATRWLRRHRVALEPIPLALFATAMSLTSAGELAVEGVPVWVDQALAKPPRNPQRPTLRENYARVTRYAAPMLKAAGNNKPVSIAFFGGRLDYVSMKPLARLFVMVAVQAQPGDRRNWQAIGAWGGSLPHLFNSSQPGNSG